MDAFFEARLDGYEEHMLRNIESATEFYPFTAGCLPDVPGANILDLGCGTGLELCWYFDRNPTARVTGIDLSEKMLIAENESNLAQCIAHNCYYLLIDRAYEVDDPWEE